MNVATITMPKDKALAAYREYREHLKTKQDEGIMLGYKQLGKGRALINPREAIAKAGFDELGRPRLAIARATAAVQRWYSFVSNGHFELEPRWTFQVAAITNKWNTYTAQVPLIPPRLRPGETQLRNYWILWEADWKEAPRDPMLLKKLTGDLYVVLATWELTDLERAAMGFVQR